MPLNSEARVPTYQDKYWHHIATTWSSETGHWKIYLDGSLVSIMHDVASNITIPAGGQLSVGEGNFEPNILHYFFVTFHDNSTSVSSFRCSTQQTQHMEL